MTMSSHGQQGRIGFGTLILVGGAGLEWDEEEEEDGVGEEECEPTSSDVIKWTSPLMSVHLRSSQTTCESEDANFFSWFGRKFWKLQTEIFGNFFF